MKTNVQNRKRNASKSKPKGVRVTSSPKRAPVSEGKVLKHFGEPVVKPLGNAGDCIVIHREYISDLLASATAGAFQVFGIPINPGNAAMFPWLSSIASNFESYVFKGLKFLFETSAPTSTPGTVLMAVDYDVSDSLPSSKRDLMSFRDSMRAPAWESCSLSCHGEDLHKRKSYYVNEVPTMGTLFLDDSTRNDLRLDDVGELIIGSSNSSVSAALGEMYVEYEVELKTPEYSSEDASSTFTWTRWNTKSNFTNTQPFGPVSNYDILDPINSPIYDGCPVIYTTPGGNSSRFSIGMPGTYSMEFAYSVTSGLSNTTYTTDSNPQNAVHNSFKAFSGTAGLESFYWTVGNTQPLDISGALAYINPIITGAVFGTVSWSSIKVTRIPDWGGTQNGGIISLAKQRPIWAMKNRHKKNYPLSIMESIHLRGDNDFVLAGSATPSDREKESPVTDGSGFGTRDVRRAPPPPGLDALCCGKGRVRCSEV